MVFCYLRSRHRRSTEDQLGVSILENWIPEKMTPLVAC